jgi:hypothetical protein
MSKLGVITLGYRPPVPEAIMPGLQLVAYPGKVNPAESKYLKMDIDPHQNCFQSYIRSEK